MSPSYNRFGFIVNEESDYETDSDSEFNTDDYDDDHDESDDDHDESDDDHDESDDDLVEQHVSSPISLRPILSSAHLPLVTPIQKIVTKTPKTPSPPPLRRSLRLKIKSELNLTALEKENKTNIVTRSQTRQKQATHITDECLSISSEPLPPSSSFNRNTRSIINPSPHPEHDEEREYYIRYCNEKKMRKTRAEFNSPLFVRRLVL